MSDFEQFDPDQHGLPLRGVSVRRAERAEVDSVAEGMAVRGGTNDDCRAAADRLMREAQFLLLAWGQGADRSRPIGWSGAMRVPLAPGGSPVWLVAGLAVAPEQRRSGVGTQLIRAVMREAGTEGECSMLHSVINARNQASIALHERLGFSEVARGTTFAGIRFEGGVGVLLSARPESGAAHVDELMRVGLR